MFLLNMEQGITPVDQFCHYTVLCFHLLQTAYTVSEHDSAILFHSYRNFRLVNIVFCNNVKPNGTDHSHNLTMKCFLAMA
jgi:hypothetical protein